MAFSAFVPLVLVAFVGHSFLFTTLLNVLYSRALPKKLLKPWRLLTGLIIFAFPLLLLAVSSDSPVAVSAASAYLRLCAALGVLYFALTLWRNVRPKPKCVREESTRTLDLRAELGAAVVGDGLHQWAARVPGNGAFQFDITDITLAVAELPPELDGLTILHLSDLHFHGTPARAYFERAFAELLNGPVPDLVCLTGDYVDTDSHHDWIRPLLEPFRANCAKLAILGNHDDYHDPERVRKELEAAGYAVLGSGWREIEVRGVPCVFVGHEGPWFPPPNVSGAPAGAFQIALSHTPDNFYWLAARGARLVLAGHVHGGAIRVPFLTSIFVPSKYGRRFDMGVFEINGAVLVVSRGVSGKEPLRLRCNPQALRLKLVRAAPS
jgi:uncharacterized protein